MKTNAQLRQVIHAALDCHTHFHNPTIINNDDYFSMGDHPRVICSTCVDRMKKAIGMHPDEELSPYYFKARDKGYHAPGY